MSTLLLEGQTDNRDDLIKSLHAEVQQLRRDLRDAQAESSLARSEAGRSVAALRLQLTPLYRALQSVFGEIDAISETTDGAVSNPRVTAVWESWKQKLPGKRADFIAALLEHGAMTGTQLRVATHTAAGSVASVIHDLKKLGLITKNGDRYSLKEL